MLKWSTVRSDLESFRLVARDWIARNCPPDLLGSDGVFQGGRREPVPASVLSWCQACFARGWTAPDWPVAVGGGGLDPDHHAVLREEFARAGAPEPLGGSGLSMIGPAILEFGTPEQISEFLPLIASGDTRWCQGFSEPNAGSDLASLTTRAEDGGDHYLINGSKLWTSFGLYADWMFCLVRTNPEAAKQRGISMVLFRMDTPGVTVEPLALISGESDFAQCFFDDVVVVKAHRLGLEDHGWTVAKRVLEHERSAVSRAGSVINSGPGTGPGGDGNTLADLCRPYWQAEPADPEIVLQRRRVAEIDMATRALSLMQRNVDRQTSSTEGSAMSVLKYVSTELTSRRMEAFMDVLGYRGIAWSETAEETSERQSIEYWMYSKSFTIAGGCSEVQLDIISKRQLGMSG